MLLGGLFASLLVFEAMPSKPGPEPEIESEAEPLSAAPIDPYVESRRSRAILEAREGSPAPFEARRESGSIAAVPAAPVQVIDGDTFVHGGKRIRIADIDTPEVHGRCAEETALAARAMRRLDALLAQGAFELNPLPNGRDEDRYGRKLRIVTRGGWSIGDVLVAEGLARTWTGRREPWCG
jgi:endonuclease YncB( thermonuclease family)